MDIAAFIQQEAEYFAPMLDRHAKASEADKASWRRETVHERRSRVSVEVFRMMRGEVQYGPFRGLRLSEETWWGRADLGAMVLGLYEKEILNEILSIRRDQYDTFIDIGAADGYYACGLLSCGKVRRAICFEESAAGRKVIAENWTRNGSPGTLEIYGTATCDSIHLLSDVTPSRCLILIDIEGSEFELISPSFLESIRGATVIIEIHNWAARFAERYPEFLRLCSEHFSISAMERVERPTAHLSELRDFTDDNRLLLASEGRPCLMRFLKLSPL